MYTELEKIKAKKEKKIMEYYKSFVKGSGLDKIKDAVVSKPITKKRRLRIAGLRHTQKQVVKTQPLTKQDEKVAEKPIVTGNELDEKPEDKK